MVTFRLARTGVRLILIVALLGLAACARTGSPGASWEDRAPYGQGLIRSERGVLKGMPGASVYRIELQITDEPIVQGRQRVRFTNQEHEPLQEVYFRLLPNTQGGQVTVSRVQVDGQAIEAAHAFQESALRVPLPRALAPGEAVVIDMDFVLQVPRELGGYYGLFGYLEGILVLDQFYPVIPVYDEEGWHAQPPPPNADPSYLDASFYIVTVTAPATFTLVASGVRTEHRKTGDQQVATFAAGPARDFYLAASDRFETVLSEKVGETRITSYALAGQEDSARLALRSAVNAIRRFSARLGPYPYTEFDIITAPMGALGIEYPGVTSISQTLYDPNAQVSGASSQVVLESTVVHEVGHQWFYNVVGNDQPNEPWLDEALVQYITGLYYLDLYGEEGLGAYRASWTSRWARVDRAEIPIGLPAAQYQGREYGAIVYGRGPLFMEALAETMGPKRFEAFLRDYYQSYQWDIGTGTAFKQLAERHCQCNLTPLFEEWVYAR